MSELFIYQCTRTCTPPPLTGEIVKALKPRMSDTQANLKPLAVTAIAHIVASLDSRTAGAKVCIVCLWICDGFLLYRRHLV